MTLTSEEQKIYDDTLAELDALEAAEGTDLAMQLERNTGVEIKLSDLSVALLDASSLTKCARKSDGLFRRGQ
jgi:hypothetical protein